MSEPRNVTPDDVRVPPAGDEGEFRTRYYHERAEEPEWIAWKWARGGRGFPWLGVLLVLLGAGLLLQYLFPQVSVGTLVLLAIGLAFIAGWIIGGSWLSMFPGVLITALGLSELIEDLALLGPAGEDVAGLASTALALGFVVIWLIGYLVGRRSTWPLWGAALFGLIGFAQLSGQLVGMPELGLLWPIVIIAIGLLLVLNARRQAA